MSLLAGSSGGFNLLASVSKESGRPKHMHVSSRCPFRPAHLCHFLLLFPSGSEDVKISPQPVTGQQQSMAGSLRLDLRG